MKTQTVKLENTPKKIIVRALKNELKSLNNNPQATQDDMKEVQQALNIINEPQIKKAKQSLNKIESIFEACGASEPRFYAYSGRFMYGDKCVGVNVDRYDYQEIIKVLKKKNVYFHSDNMGLDMVIYFKDIPAEGVLTEEEEEETA